MNTVFLLVALCGISGATPTTTGLAFAPALSILRRNAELSHGRPKVDGNFKKSVYLRSAKTQLSARRGRADEDGLRNVLSDPGIVRALQVPMFTLDIFLVWADGILLIPRGLMIVPLLRRTRK